MAKFIAHSPNGQAYQCDSLAEVKQVEGGFKFRKAKKRNPWKTLGYEQDYRGGKTVLRPYEWINRYVDASGSQHTVRVEQTTGVEVGDAFELFFRFYVDRQHVSDLPTIRVSRKERAAALRQAKAKADEYAAHKGWAPFKKRNGGCGCGGACGNPHCGPKKRNGKRPADQYQFAAWQEKAKGMTDAQLLYVIKDAREAAKAMRGHDPVSEGWYEDEANTMAQELYRRRQGKHRNPGKIEPYVNVRGERGWLVFNDRGDRLGFYAKKADAQSILAAYGKASYGKHRNPTGATLSEDYNMAVFAGAVEHGRLPADDASAEYKKGYAEGARIAKENKLAVAAAMGAFRTTGSQKRAGQMLREMAGKSPTSPVNNPRKKRRNGLDPRYVPVTMNPKPKGKYLAHEKEEEQIFASMLAKLPVGVTMQAGKHRVRKLSKGYVVVDGERLGMKDAAAKLHGR